MLLIAVVLVDQLACILEARRVGEASHPGPGLRWDFDLADTEDVMDGAHISEAAGAVPTDHGRDIADEPLENKVFSMRERLCRGKTNVRCLRRCRPYV